MSQWSYVDYSPYVRSPMFIIANVTTAEVVICLLKAIYKWSMLITVNVFMAFVHYSQYVHGLCLLHSIC